MSFVTPPTATITELSSKKTRPAQSHLITPPRSTESQRESTPQCGDYAGEKSLQISRYIETTSYRITSIWDHKVKSLFDHQPSAQAFSRFITEVMRRSRCSLSALNGALFYLSKLRPQIEERATNGLAQVLNCPKKVFLICLVLSFKFQYDSTYNLKAWSKISGLPVQALKQLEMKLLKCLDYDLNLNCDAYAQWLTKHDVTIVSAPAPVVCKRSRDDMDTVIVKRNKISCN